MTPVRTPHLFRRALAALGAAVYFASAYVAPIVHISVAHGGSRLAQAAVEVDLTKLLDPRTGRVDLDKLAAALELKGGHDESRPHSHGPGDPSRDPLEHGRGSFAHFGVAFIAAAPVPFVPQLPVALPRLAPRLDLGDVSAELRFLAVQRAQAPPA